jgi:hypothetical protein
MRALAIIAAVLTVSVALAGTAAAATKKTRPVVVAQTTPRTVVQPTRTIIHNPDGTTTIIVTPRRSYLNPGTETSVGDSHQFDYMLPPGGDPGRPDWWYGPDHSGGGYYMVTNPFYLPGINANNPF